VLPLLPLLLPDYELFRATSVLVLLPVIIGVNLVVGYGGQFVMLSAAMSGVGGYVTIVLLNAGLPLAIALPAAGAVSGVLGVAFGALVSRLRTIYLALTSISVATALTLAMSVWIPITGGDNGLAYPAQAFEAARSAPVLYCFVLGVAGCGLVIAWRLVSAQYGRLLVASRTNEIASISCGVDVFTVRRTLIGLACVYWGIGGALYAQVSGFISPTDFGLDVATIHLALAVIGGLATFDGPILGTLTIAGARDLLTLSNAYQTLLFGALLYVVIRLMPGGLSGAIARIRQRATSNAGSASTRDVSGDSMRLEWHVQPPPTKGAPGEPLLVIDGVTVSFGGIRALDRVNLDIKRQTVHAIVGPNGSGKTTLLNAICRINRPTSGSVTLDGTDLLRVAPHRLAGLGVARTFQTPQTFKGLTAIENVLVGAQTIIGGGFVKDLVRGARYRHILEDARARAGSLLIGLGVSPAELNRGSETLNLNDQRRVELARALAGRPTLILLDEPAAGLTEVEWTDLARSLRRIRESGVTVVVVEHNSEFVRRVADTATLLDHGAVVTQGLPRFVLQHEHFYGARASSPESST
jgi:ABC-type branched-subunit amino acid transport system ATPase component/ABC-type branched-subunit amino acid transport system permease subunit